jgi:hypothetical protein
MWTNTTALVALGLGVITLSALADARHTARAGYASPFPWCAQWGGKRGGANECSYFSFEQCFASIWGAGGHCYPNPAYVPPVAPPPRPRKHRR